MRVSPEDLSPYTNEASVSFVEPWRPTSYELYETTVNGTEDIKIVKVYGRPKSIGRFRSMALSIGNWGLIHREETVKDNHEFPIHLSLPTLDEDTSFFGGYAHHTAVVMSAMLKNHWRMEGGSVVEYGSGSGAVGLLALRLGAKHVTLIERDTELCKKAALLYTHAGIHPDSYKIINDDLENVGQHEYLLRHATVGIANLGHWNEYKNAQGEYADMLAYRAVQLSRHMHTLISGGYTSGFSWGSHHVVMKEWAQINPQVPVPWIERSTESIREAGYELQSHGFEAVDYFDSKACLPLTGTTHAVVAVRDVF
jgi:hypothetical protein